MRFATIRHFALWGCASALLAGACGESSKSSASSSSTGATTTTVVATTTSTVPKIDFDHDAGLTLVKTIGSGFSSPTFVSVDAAQSRLYVVDSVHGRVVSLALDGTDPVDIRAGATPFDFSFHGALGAVDVAADGTLFVAESGSSRVVHITTAGKVLGELKQSTSFARLFSASVDRARNLVYVVDDERDEIVVFDTQGKVVRTLAGSGTTPGRLHDPGSVEVNADGTIWVADAGNGRVQHLRADGSVIRVLGPFAASAPGHMEYPNDIAVDAAGRVWTTDFEGGGVVVFGADGTPLGRFGLPALAKPVSLAFDRSGRLYVTDEQNDVVNVFTTNLT